MPPLLVDLIHARACKPFCEKSLTLPPSLAAEMGVCERTIRRDIEVLTLSYPIETCCGRYGGVKMANWYHRDRRRLTPRQADLLRRLAADLQDEDLEAMNQILIQFAS